MFSKDNKRTFYFLKNVYEHFKSLLVIVYIQYFIYILSK